MSGITFLVLDNPSPEETRAREWLARGFPDEAAFATLQDLLSGKYSLSPEEIFWLHTDRHLDWSPLHKTMLNEQLQHLLRQNGNIFLTLMGSLLPFLLDWDREAPNRVRSGIWTNETGEQQIRGIMGCRDHPVFAPFHGGIYTWRPVPRESYTYVAYTEGHRPVQAKIIGVERFYIGFDPGVRIAWEQNLASGAVLCVGAFVYFAMTDPLYENHLKKFISTCLTYLKHRLPDGMVRPCFEPGSKGLFRFRRRIQIPPMEFMDFSSLKQGGKKFLVELPGDDFWDLAGKRALVMGKETGGIDEIWFHPFRAFKTVQFRIFNVDNNFKTIQFEAYPRLVTRIYSQGENRIEENIFCCLDEPVVVLTYTTDSSDKIQLEFQAATDLRLMWPYPPESIGEIGLQIGRCDLLLTDSGRKILAGMVCNTSFESFDFSLDEESKHSEVNLRFRLGVSRGQSLQLVLFGWNQGIPGAEEALHQILPKLSNQIRKSEQYLHEIHEKGGLVETPDESVNRALQWACWKLHDFAVVLPEMGAGMFAGYGTTRPGWFASRPGYAWYFGRDSAWCGFALLHLGTYALVREILNHFIRYQEFTGKIYHEMTSGGVVHYDAADSTPLFLLLLAEYIHHTDDRDYLIQNWSAARKAYEYCVSTDRDGDGFIENTDSGHGWIEGGRLYGAHVTTYLAAIWVRTVAAVARMSALVGDEQLRKESTRRFEQIHSRFDDLFAEPEGEFYSHGIDRSGNPYSTLTIMPGVAIFLGVGEKLVQTTLKKLDTCEFHTDWGARMISDRHPDFDPSGYHLGSVWPLYTGWISLADYRVQRSLPAWQHWMQQIPLFHDFAKGCMPEVLHGDRYEFSGICPHQAWSEAMVVLPFYRGLLGLKPLLDENKLLIKPQIPDHWPWLNISRLPVGNRKLSCHYRRNREKLTFLLVLEEGDPLEFVFMISELAFLPIKTVWLNGRPIRMNRICGSGQSSFSFSCTLKKKKEISITYSYYLRFIPEVSLPQKHQPATGYMVVEEIFTEKQYRVVIHGRSGTRNRGRLLAIGLSRLQVTNAELVPSDQEYWDVFFSIPPSADPYREHEIKIAYKV